MHRNPQEGLTDDELRRIAQRAARATPGPWYWITKDHDEYHVFGDGELSENRFDRSGRSPMLDKYVAVPLLTVWDNDGESSNDAGCFEDADFVTAARSDVPALLAEVHRLRAVVARLMPPEKGDE